jgi:uncharacterized protein (TIGR03083 family)
MTYRTALPAEVLPGTLVLRTGGACELHPGRLLTVFGHQRRRFVAALREFGPEDWAAPTRCPGWSAQDVVRHICDSTVIGAGDDGRTLDLAAGFDPRISPCHWLEASEGEDPAQTLARLVAASEDLAATAWARLALGRRMEAQLPYGPMDWTVLLLHVLWDSWIHERDVLLARGAKHPTDADTTGYAAAYGVFIAAAVASMFGDQVQDRLMLGGDGGGVFDLDSGEAVTLTVNRADAGGPPAAEITDALAGRPPAAAILNDLPARSRVPLSHLATFFNTPV